MKKTITYLKGDATAPIETTKGEIQVIFHICNDINRWGKGFVLAVSNHWPLAKDVYHRGSQQLGTVSIAQCEDTIYVANLIAQHGIKAVGGVPPIRYEAFRDALVLLAQWARSLEADRKTRVSFHGPRMGAGLAGGDWKRIEVIIIEVLAGFPVFIYDL